MFWGLLLFAYTTSKHAQWLGMFDSADRLERSAIEVQNLQHHARQQELVLARAQLDV